MMGPPLLDVAKRRLGAGSVLVALDFDGTLSEIVTHADAAVAVPGALDALRDLAEVEEFEVAVVSGRPLADLRRLLGPPDGVRLVGEHGAAWEGVRSPRPDGFDEVRTGLEAIAERYAGAWVEVKETSLCFHTRQMSDEMESDAVAAVLALLDRTDPGPDRAVGKKVVDVTFVSTSKGAAIERLRADLDIQRVLFIGDDITDETVFERLGPDDLGIKVGDGQTAAEFRVAGPTEVVDFLVRLASSRRPSR